MQTSSSCSGATQAPRHLPAGRERQRERWRKRDTERSNPSHPDPGLNRHTLVTLEQSLTGHSLIQNVSQVFWSKFHGLPNFPLLLQNSQTHPKLELWILGLGETWCPVATSGLGSPPPSGLDPKSCMSLPT